MPDRSQYVSLCWDCHEPLRGDGVPVPTIPALAGVSDSTTRVCADCAERRRDVWGED